MTGPAEASKHDCSGTEDRLVEGVGKAFEQRRDRALAGRIAGGTIGEQDDWHTVVIAVLSASEAECGAGLEGMIRHATNRTSSPSTRHKFLPSLFASSGLRRLAAYRLGSRGRKGGPSRGFRSRQSAGSSNVPAHIPRRARRASASAAR